MRAEPLISVAIPSFNHESYISESIISIVNQSYKNIELIIIDDGSSDGSASMIESLAELCKKRFVRFEFRARENKGLCATLNEALTWAQGDYFSPFASDDVASNDKIEFLVEKINGNDDVGAVFGKSAGMDGTIKARSLETMIEHRFDRLILHKDMPDTPTALIRTACIRAVGAYAEDVRLEDWYLWLKLTENNYRLLSYPKVLAFYRRHDGNITNNINLLHQERLKVVEKFKHHACYKSAYKNLSLVAARHAEKIDKRLAFFYLRQYGLFKIKSLTTLLKMIS